MTVTANDGKVSYSGNGSTTVFAYDFRILDESEVLVQLEVDSTEAVTTQTITTHYTVSGVGDAGGGNITMVTAPASGETLHITRNVTKSQATDYTENDAFPAETHEDALDKLTMIAQEHDEEIGRSIKLPLNNSSITDTTLKNVTASYFVKINDAGDGFTCQASSSSNSELDSLANLSSTGLISRTADDTHAVRTITGTSNQITVTDGDGVSGNPTLAITSNPTIPGTSHMVVPIGTTAQRPVSPAEGYTRANSTINQLEYYNGTSWQPLSADTDTGGTGLVIQTGTDTFVARTVTGTSNEIDVADGDGQAANPTIGISDNPTIPGTSHLILPKGTTAQRTGTDSGETRFNIDTNKVEYFDGSTWQALTGTGFITAVVDDTSPQAGGTFDFNSYNAQFDDATGIEDDSGNEQLIFQKTASAVNHVEITNAATAGSPSIAAVGDDTNVGLTISAKGTGNITVGNFVFDADQTVGAGQDNYVLTYDNSGGVISLEAASGGGSASPFYQWDAAEFSATEANIAPLTYINGTTVDMLVRAFDDTTEEYVNGKFVLPASIGSGNVTFRAYVYAATAAASKNIALTFGHRALNDSEAFDGAYTDEDSGDAAIDATQGDVTEVTWTETVANLGWAAGDIVIFRLSRDPAATNDLTGDMYLLGFSVELP